jgi:hypothetical protein
MYCTRTVTASPQKPLNNAATPKVAPLTPKRYNKVNPTVTIVHKRTGPGRYSNLVSLSTIMIPLRMHLTVTAHVWNVNIFKGTSASTIKDSSAPIMFLITALDRSPHKKTKPIVNERIPAPSMYRFIIYLGTALKSFLNALSILLWEFYINQIHGVWHREQNYWSIIYVSKQSKV